MRTRGLALGWMLIVLALLGWLAWRLGASPAVSADLLSLLPGTEEDPALAQASERFRQRFERRVVFLIAAPEAKLARHAADHLLERLEASQQFADLHLRHGGGDLEQIGALYFSHRFQLLAERTREQLRRADDSAFERDLLARYFSPLPALSSELVRYDPLLLLSRFLGERATAAGGRFEVEDGYLTPIADDRVLVLLNAELARSPFSFAVQEQVATLIAGLRSELPERFAGSELLIAGVLLHAIAGTDRAQAEITIVGLGSLFGIVILFLVVFRSWRPLGLSLAAIALGCLAGLAACLAVFGQVHLLTLVFGASLVGISVDYSLHYFCEGFRLGDGWSPDAALGHIFAGITLGLITSIVGFAGLLVAPFPGLRQMAVFSSAGLLFAYGSVVTCYPLLTRAPMPAGAPRLLPLVASYARLWRGRWGWPRTLACVLVAGILVAGCLRLRAEDDIRLLQSRDPAVVQEEERVRAALGRAPASQFFLVEGRDAAELLAREEALTARLRALEQEGALAGHLALSDALPSPTRQAENRALLASVIEDPVRLEGIADATGLEDALLRSYATAFRDARDQPPLGLAEWLQSPAAAGYGHLWLGPSARGSIAAVSLEGVRDPAALRSLASPAEGVHFVDRVADLSALFGEHRRTTMGLTLAAYLVVTVLLQLRYGLSGGLAAMTPPLLAAIASLGLLGLLGEPVSLFNILALLLVLGIGVDYAVFFRETGFASDTTVLAIALSAITTILAFGLLAFSATDAIRAFGLTIMIGIGAAFLLSPIAGAGAKEHRA